MQNILLQINASLKDLTLEISAIKTALQQQETPKSRAIAWDSQIAAIWQDKQLIGINANLTMKLEYLHGIDDQKQALELNTQNFLQSKPYNNVLITGARGMGKSSLVAGILQKYSSQNLRLIQVKRSEFSTLEELFVQIADLADYKFIIFFDDLAFEKNDADYKNLKSVLDNGLNLIPKNICIIATSNRKHLIPEKMQDNLDSIVVDSDLRPSDTIEETISLADRFGLWLSFYAFNQADYLEVVKHWLQRLQLEDSGTIINSFAELDQLTQLEALRFATRRGVRNGRMAKHFAIYWLMNKP